MELSEKTWPVTPQVAERIAKPEAVEEEKHKHRHIPIDVSDAKIHDIFRGVLKLLKDGGAVVKVSVNVEAKGKISDQTLKMKDKETLKQLGVKFEVEEE